MGNTLRGKWTLDRVLGIGGMAAVYAASHRNGATAAIKILHPAIAAQPEARDRFLREAYIANKAGHEGIVGVLDDDVDEEGAPYLVMELLSGETVAARAERHGNRLALAEVLAIANETLSALEAAHAHAIVHRDIKPENLFYTTTKRIKVLDFGIARMREQTTQKKTQTGLLLGTPGYMAPEQALGRWNQVDARTDLWAVGATIFNLLSGEDVHEGATDNERIINAATRPARSLARVMPNLPTDIVRFVDRSLEFDQSKRFPDARTMRAELERLIEAQPSRAASSRAATLAEAAPSQSETPSAPALGSGSGDRPLDQIFGRISATPEEVAALRELFLLFDKALTARIQYGLVHKESARRFEAVYRHAVLSIAASDGQVAWNVSPYAFVVAGEVLWEPKPPLDQIPYRLFSDGVRAMAFSRDLEERELHEFARILMSDPAKDIGPEDDLATLMWDARFEHISHEEIDSYAEGNQDERARFEKERQKIMALANFDTSDQLEDCWRARPRATAGGVTTRHGALLGALGAAASAQASGVRLTERADVLAVDPATLRVLAARFDVNLVDTGERFVAATARAFVLARTEGKASAIATPLRTAVDGLASVSVSDAIAMVRALGEAVLCATEAGGEELAAAMTGAVLSPATLQQILAGATRDLEQARFADGVAALLARLDDSHFDAVLAVLPDAKDEALRACLLGYIARTGRGHEPQLGDLVAQAEMGLALSILRVLIAMGTKESREAASRASQSPHPVVRIEALGHVEGLSSDRLRLEMRALLEDPEPGVRLATLRAMARYHVKAGGPSLVLRIRTSSFDSLSGDERRQALETLNALMPSRAEAIAIELLSETRIVSSETHEQSRELAAELLARTGTSDEARDALENAAKARWKNSERVRGAAARALVALAERAARPPPLRSTPAPRPDAEPAPAPVPVPSRRSR